MNRIFWIVCFLILGFAASAFAGPTIDGCLDDFKLIEQWENENPEEAGRIAEKYSELDKLIEEKDFDALRAPMIAAYKEGLALAGGDVACADPLTQMSIEIISGGLIKDVTVTNQDAGQPGPVPDCEREMDLITDWQINSPEEAQAIHEKYPGLEELLDNGEYEEAREPLTDLCSEELAAVGGDPECAPIIAGKMLDELELVAIFASSMSGALDNVSDNLEFDDDEDEFVWPEMSQAYEKMQEIMNGANPVPERAADMADAFQAAITQMQQGIAQEVPEAVAAVFKDTTDRMASTFRQYGTDMIGAAWVKGENDYRILNIYLEFGRNTALSCDRLYSDLYVAYFE